MSMQVIALTSANERAMQAVAAQLLGAATTGQLRLSVLVGVKTAHEAAAVFQGGGELWRIGPDNGKPELDPLVDRAIDDTAPGRMASEVAQGLRRFMTRAAIAERRAA
jgi:hypothetical protein